MSVDADAEMPERYAAPTVTEHRVYGDARRTPPRPMLNIPPVALHNWIDCQGGDTLKIAPKSPTAVTVGFGVQPDLGTFAPSDDKRYTTRQLSARLPTDALTYLGVEQGDTVLVKNVDGPRIVVEVKE